MSELKSICVYCGSSKGDNECFTQSAIDLARAMIAKDIDLVYGGTNKGLMKIMADEFIKHRKTVTGIISQSFVDMGLVHPNITKTVIVDTITERRKKLIDFSDGFIAMSGGIGTLREIFELLSFTQLDILKKPCGILNTASFYDLMIQFLEHCKEMGFIMEEHSDILLVDDNPNNLLNRLLKYDVKNIPKYFKQKFSLNGNTIFHEM